MKIILLDLGMVIVQVDFSIFCNTLSKGDASKSEYIYKKYCIGKIKEELDNGKIGPTYFFEQIIKDVDSDIFDINRIRTLWSSIFSEVPESLEAINRLKNEYLIWVVSDTDPVHFNYIINEHPIIQEAKRFYLSYSMGVSKNAPAFFSKVLEESAYPASDFILIDDRQDNCEMAKKSGMESIQFVDWKSTMKYL